MGSKFNASLIDEKDNVVVAVENLTKGSTVIYIDHNNVENKFELLDDVRIYHKIAIKNIDADKPVIKYGETIGFTTRDILKGQHVHDHNIEGRRENLKEKE